MTSGSFRRPLRNLVFPQISASWSEVHFGLVSTPPHKILVTGLGFIYASSGPLHSKVLLLEAYFATFSSTISNQSLPKNAKNVIPKNQGLRDRTRGGARGALPFPALFVRKHKYRNRCIFTITTNFKNPSPHPQNWFVNHPSSPNGNYLSSYPYGPLCGHLPWHEFLFEPSFGRSWILETLDRKLADAIGSNTVEKCDITLSRAIQPLTFDVLRVLFFLAYFTISVFD